VLHRGKQVYVQGEPLFTTEYSDSLLIFLLKAYNPDRFRERIEQTNLLEIDPKKLTPAQRDVIAQHLIEKAFADHPQLVAEARSRIEAEEAVTVEAMYEYAAERVGVSQDLRGAIAEPTGGREP